MAYASFVVFGFDFVNEENAWQEDIPFTDSWIITHFTHFVKYDQTCGQIEHFPAFFMDESTLTSSISQSFLIIKNRRGGGKEQIYAVQTNLDLNRWVYIGELIPTGTGNNSWSRCFSPPAKHTVRKNDNIPSEHSTKTPT